MIDSSKKLPMQVVLAEEEEEVEEEDADAPAKLQREKPPDMRLSLAQLFLSKALNKYQAQEGQQMVFPNQANL